MVLLQTRLRRALRPIRSVLRWLLHLLLHLAYVVNLAITLFTKVVRKLLHPALAPLARTKLGSRLIRHYRTTHHHIAHRPHQHLMAKSNLYNRWHSWQYKWLHHGHVHGLIVLVAVASFVGLGARTLAADTGFSWNFNNPGDYSFNSSKIEANSNNLRLKLSDAVKNFSVADGQLQSNNILDVTADNSYYFVSSDLGIDVIRQDTWQRSAFITAGGGFRTVAVADGYLYAGKNGGIYRWQISSLGNNTALGTPRYSTTSSPAMTDQDVKRINTITIAGKVYLSVTTGTHAHVIKDDQGTPSIVKALSPGGWFITGAVLTSDGTMYYDLRENGMGTGGAILVKYGAINQLADWSWTATSVDYGNDWAPLHGPDPPKRKFTGLKVTEGTSTANAGNNTIYVESDDGLIIIQENRVTPSASTINAFANSAKGANLLAGTQVQARTGVATNVNDNNLGSYYIGQSNQMDEWLEFDLGSAKTFNHLRQFFWSDVRYMPSAYTIEASTQGTSANIATSATPRSQWTHPSYPANNGKDNNYGSFFYTLFGSGQSRPLYELSFPSSQQIGGVDLQFYDQGSSGKNYDIEGSTMVTTPIAVTALTASSIYTNNATYNAQKAYDNNAGSRWISGVSTSTAPQWLQLDLSSSQTIAGLSFVTEAGTTIKDYSVQYSNDATNWSNAHSVTNNTSLENRVTFSSSVTGRYVRLYVTQSGNINDAGAVRVVEIEPYSSMFESGSVSTLATVTNNSSLARSSSFSPTTVKSVRVKVHNTYTPNANFGIREMKVYNTAFDSGTVTQLKSISGLAQAANYYGASTSHDTSFSTTTARYLRVKYTGYGGYSSLTSEVELNNTTLPGYAPIRISNSSMDVTNNRYYSVHNSSAVQDGRILRIDGVTTNTPVIGQTIDKNSIPNIASNEFNSVKVIDENRMVVGTTDSGASFVGKRYALDAPTIEPNQAYSPAAVASWQSFTESATKNGGEIYYQISNDDGLTYHYWDGASWAPAGSGEYSTAATIDQHIEDFPVGTRDFKWKAYLVSNGSQAIVLNGVDITINPDINPPSDNADNIIMKTGSTGNLIAENAWVSTNSPYFQWSPGQDDNSPGASGVKGYCLYLGPNAAADPAGDKGYLGSSQIDTDSACPFAVGSASLNLATSGLLSTPLASATSPYYIKIKVLDNSNNLYQGASEDFHFRFDNSAPNAPGFVSAPSQFLASRDVTLTWPTTGDQMANDGHSGLLGLQYRIGGEGTWYGVAHNGAQDITDILPNNGSYRTDENIDYPNIIEGNNIVYFRAVDQAGNFSTSYTTAAIKVNTSAPSQPRSVTATPTTNVTNSFAFNWAVPSSFVGGASGLKYCYTINTLPTAQTCTFTAAGVTTVPAGPFATQPGENTFYVVAQDEANNINYATYESVKFTANTSAPGIPTNIEIADISTRAIANWKLALSWAAPTDSGAGVANYRIFRSEDNSAFSQIATTAGLSYVDSGLQTAKRYYYRVKACDSANNCGVNGSTVSLIPTGRYTEPAELVARPVVTNITTKRAQVNWSTNRESDSKIAVGKAPGSYFAAEISNSSQVTYHSIELNNLDAGTKYYMVARWTDEDGNTGVSSEFSFTTAPAPVVKEVKTDRVSLSSALLGFTSKDATRAAIHYGKSESLGGEQSVNTSLSESTYNIELTGLDDDTKYYFRVTLYDNEGGEYRGDLYSFTTPARPRISNLHFQPLAGEPTSSQVITWNTNVPTTSLIRLTSTGLAAQELSDSVLKTDHKIVVRGLVDDTEYRLLAESRDAGGNIATSEAQTLRTALDTRPPKISDIVIETSVRGMGAEARGQIVISWKTDEPSTSQVAFAEGSQATGLQNKSAEDTALTTDHVVVISDVSTSKVYSVQPLSADKSKNIGLGGVDTAIIGRASNDVITIVLTTIKGIFGF